MDLPYPLTQRVGIFTLHQQCYILIFMHCPNCKHHLKTIIADNQNILHCGNCGSSFFEENSINRIKISTAKKLAKDKKINLILSYDKHCPKDNQLLTRIYDEEAVPTSVSLFRCSVCHGIFTYPHDLITFKQAQRSKLAYFKLWDNPLPSLRSVLVLSVIAAFTLGIINLTSHVSRLSTNTNASGVITSTSFIYSGNQLFVMFKTTQPFISRIVIIDKTNNQSSEYTVSNTPSTSHFINITNPPPQKNNIYYQIILKDNEDELKTDEMKLEKH